MAELQKFVKVTQAQYNTLKNGGTVGSYTGIDPNYIYLVENEDWIIVDDNDTGVVHLPQGILYIQTSDGLYGGIVSTTETGTHNVYNRTLASTTRITVDDYQLVIDAFNTSNNTARCRFQRKRTFSDGTNSSTAHENFRYKQLM